MKNEEIDSSVVVYDTISVKEMEYEESDSTFYFPCPCGDLFELTLSDMIEGLRVATCPSCSLQIGVVISKEELEEISALRNICPTTLTIMGSLSSIQTFESLL